MSSDAALRDLARQLLLHENHQGKAYESAAQPGRRAFEKLRTYLSKLVGVSGFQALLTRALSQGKEHAPSLIALRVKDDGALEGFDEDAPRETADALEMLLAQLLGLLVTFIGQELTLQLMRDVWPDAALDNIKLSKGAS